jgi:hypothetical protein
MQTGMSCVLFSLYAKKVIKRSMLFDINQKKNIPACTKINSAKG